MRSKALSITLMVLVASMIVANPAAFAEVKPESLVNLATQARTQIKLQLDNSQDVSQQVRELYVQGDEQTNMLIAAAEDGDVAAAKKHFMSAMKIFRQITQSFSAPAPATREADTEEQPQAFSATMVSDESYRNDLLRTERYINTLKISAEKSNLEIDFAKAGELILNAKQSLARGDLGEVDRLLSELKAEQTQIIREIKEQTLQQSNARVRAFVNDYIVKIDAILSQADELGLSESDIAKLTKIKEELESTRDAGQLIIKIKHYSVSISVDDYKTQKVRSELARLESKLKSLEPSADEDVKPKFDEAKKIIAGIKNQTLTDDPVRAVAALESIIQEIERYIQSKTNEQQRQQESVQERAPQDTKKARQLAEVERLEEKLKRLEPHIEDNMQSKFDTARSLLGKIRVQAESDDPSFSRTAKALDLLIDQIQDLINQQQRGAETPERSSDRQNGN